MSWRASPVISGQETIIIRSISFLGCTIGFLPLMGWRQGNENGKICWFIVIAPKLLILLTVTIGAIPVITVFILYSIILYRTIQKIIEYKKSQHPTSEDTCQGGLRMFRGGSHAQENIEQSDRRHKPIFVVFRKKSVNLNANPNKWKAVKVVVFTMGSFIITWTPYYIACIIYTMKCEFNSTEKECMNLRNLIASPLAILGFMNSFLNPIIYAWWHKGFRNYLKRKWWVMSLRRESRLSVEEHKHKHVRSVSSTETRTSRTE